MAAAPGQGRGGEKPLRPPAARGRAVRRAWALAAAGLAADAAAATGQDVGAPAPARLSVAAYGGYGLDYTIPTTSLSFGGEGAERVERDLELGGRATFGLEASKPLSGRVVGIAGWRYETESSCDGPQACPESLAMQGPNSVFQLGVGLAFGGRAPLTVHAGASLSTGDSAASDLGLLFGAFLDIPAPGSSLAVRLGVEDRLAFWENEDAFVDLSGALRRGPSQLVSLRAGLAYRP